MGNDTTVMKACIIIEVAIDSSRYHDGAIGRTSDLQFIGCGFKTCLGTKQYNLVPVKGQ